MEKEIWKDIPNYEGLYQVSSVGRVKSVSRTVYGKRVQFLKERIMKPTLDANDYYYYVKLRKDGRYKKFYVHRLVCIAFVPNPNNHPCIDHINDDQTDNRACNLQWCTHKFNNSKEHHCLAESLSQRGKILTSIRKPIVQLSTNGDLIQIFPSMTDADLKGFQHSAIHRVIHNKLKTHRGFKWMYLSDYEKSLVNQ
jgi:hypothetical protein